MGISCVQVLMGLQGIAAWTADWWVAGSWGFHGGQGDVKLALVEGRSGLWFIEAKRTVFSLSEGVVMWQVPGWASLALNFVGFRVGV